jgi:hypothetical protein
MYNVTAVKKLPVTLGFTLTRNYSKRASSYFSPVIVAAAALMFPK